MKKSIVYGNSYFRQPLSAVAYGTGKKSVAFCGSFSGGSAVLQLMALWEKRLDLAMKENRIGKFRFDLLTESRRILLFPLPNPDAASLLHKMADSIFPVNREFSETPSEQKLCGKNGRGVSVEKNFNYMFAHCKRIYPSENCGSFPESEEESRALAMFARKNHFTCLLHIEEGAHPPCFPTVASAFGAFCERFLSLPAVLNNRPGSLENWLSSECAVPAGTVYLLPNEPAEKSFEKLLPLLISLLGY